MTLRFAFVFTIALLTGCGESDQLLDRSVLLIPEDSLRAVLPAEIDSFTTFTDTTYRGYRENEELRAAQIVLARIYSTESGRRIALNVSSFDNYEHALAVYGDGIERDSLAERETYEVPFGRVAFVGNDRSVEAKGFEPELRVGFLERVDYARLESFEAVPTAVDSTFDVVRE